jgi:hypothetical protein
VKGRDENDVKRRALSLARNKGRPEAVLRKEIEDAVAGAVDWLKEHPLAKRHQYGNGNGAGSNGNGSNSSIGMHEWPWTDGIRRLPPASKWQLPVDEKLIRRIISKSKGAGNGWLKPRIRFELGELYAGLNYVLCLAKNVYAPKAQTLDYWRERGVRDMQWMVPNPCMERGDGGRVKTDLNGGERIWLIIEFDKGTLDDQAKLLRWLGDIDSEWELALIVYSGGKSLHGWFSCVGKLEHQDIFKFFRRATTLGCDRMMRSFVQYTRVPLGINSKSGRRQEIAHWSQAAIDFHNEKLVSRRLL